jgi:hypothetical protein
MTTTDAFFLSWSRPTPPMLASAAPARPPQPRFLARHPRLLDALRVLMRRPTPHAR